ncbi:MAG: hypothetical protein VKM01_03115 [Cyanobacteriota bacterium]|nr:hypothetical protein [Cyanobacteriota bacterium]
MKPLVIPSAASGQANNKPVLEAEKALLDEQARLAASSGDLEQAGRAILASLDCERRLSAVGPQVLQLIKPRP